jgi:peroxiredoxin
MHRWPIVLGIVVGFAGFVALSLWHHLDRRVEEFFNEEPAPPGIQPTWPAPEQPTTAEEASPPGTAPRPSPQAPSEALPPSFGPLFTAMGLYQPGRRTLAPDFTLPDLDGQPFRLRQLEGRLVLLNFWATWCAPCLTEMPSMQRLHQTFKQTEFALLAVSLDRQGGPAVKAFAEARQLTFPILLDPTNEVSRAYGVRGLPSTYLIGPDGYLIAAAVGARDWSRTEAKALIAGLLRQAAASPGRPAQARQ